MGDTRIPGRHSAPTGMILRAMIDRGEGNRRIVLFEISRVGKEVNTLGSYPRDREFKSLTRYQTAL